MFEYNVFLDDSEDTEIMEPQGFVIDSVGIANWAVCKIKEARNRRDMFNQAAEEKIEQMSKRIQENNARCDSETAFLLSALGEYIEKVPAKATKTQKTLILPDGKLKKKHPVKVLKPDEEKLLEYLNDEEEYIKITKKPVWSEFKKLLKETDGKVIRMDTGEIIEAVTIEEKPAMFDIE